ncbi:MAG: hypothetical protein ACRDNW_11525 [Trebonia sp.]
MIEVNTRWGYLVGLEFDLCACTLLEQLPPICANVAVYVPIVSGGPKRTIGATDDLAAGVNRLERLAAERVQNVQGWWVMRDQAGLLSCVLPMSPGSLNGQNARRWE